MGDQVHTNLLNRQTVTYRGQSFANSCQLVIIKFLPSHHEYSRIKHIPCMRAHTEYRIDIHMHVNTWSTCMQAQTEYSVTLFQVGFKRKIPLIRFYVHTPSLPPLNDIYTITFLTSNPHILNTVGLTEIAA